MNSDFFGDFYESNNLDTTYEEDYYKYNEKFIISDKPRINVKNIVISNKMILLFKKIILSKSKVSLDLLTNNSKSLIINRKGLFSNGEYDVKRNTITIGRFNRNIFHQMLHVASSYYDKNNDLCYSGLCQYNHNFKFNYGITEALTEELTDKYFIPIKKRKVTVLKQIIDLLSYVIPINMMEKYYFEANLNSFINYLSNYLELDEVIKLLSDIDYISSFELENGFDSEIDEVIVRIGNTIVKMIRKKNIDDDDVNEKVYNLINH